MNMKSLINLKKMLFRLNDSDFIFFLCYGIDTAQLLHLLLKISHPDFPQLSVVCLHLYLQQLRVKHYHMRLVLHFALTTGGCDCQVTGEVSVPRHMT